MSLKNPVTPPRIDPGTVRLVAQRLNHYATAGPLKIFITDSKSNILCEFRVNICGFEEQHQVSRLVRKIAASGY